MMTATTPYIQSRVYMDTVVTIQVPHGAGLEDRLRVERAFSWFREVESRCSRFDSESEIRLLCRRVDIPTPVSPLLYRALEFAVVVAFKTDGAFDPTVGALMERRGFNQNYRTGEIVSSAIPVGAADFRSIVLDAAGQAVTLRSAVVIDLGAVAKGLAIDLAARELKGLDGFLINAGGDILVQGRDPEGGPWRIGIKDPQEPVRVAKLLSLTMGAVCTSGGYERPAAGSEGHHIVSPKSGRSPDDIASVTAVSSSAMVADALSTAAFALGVEGGLSLLADEHVEGLIIDGSGRQFTTSNLWRYV